MMSRTLQIVWVSAASVLILLAVCVLTGSYQLLTRLELLHTAPPICLPVDLSSPGVYSGCYRRSYAAVLDDQLRLVVAGSPSEEEVTKALSGLCALLVLRDEAGRVIDEQVVGVGDFHEWVAHQKSGVAVTLPLDKAGHQAGNYHLSIDVKTPAKGMAGHAHCIVAELGLSNIEGMAAHSIGIPAGWLALLIGIVMLARKRCRGPAGLEYRDAGDTNPT